MTATAKRKSTAPRKAAKARVNGTNGQTNGHPLPPASEAELRAPERFEPDTPPPEPVAPPTIEHPYGDVLVYAFFPKVVQPGDSMDPIVLPHITSIDADVEFFWELDELDPMHQSFRYMQRAKVPRDIQRRVVRLPAQEMGRLLNGWFQGVVMPQGVGPPGES